MEIVKNCQKLSQKFMFQSLAGHMVPPMPCVMFQNQMSPCHLMSCPQTLSLSISLASRLLKIGLKSLKARSSHNTFLFFSLLEFHSWRWKIISNIFYKRVRAKIRLVSDCVIFLSQSCQYFDDCLSATCRL